MGFFDFFKSIDINSGLEQYRNTDGAVLVDVRTEEEYAEGHIPSSINIPLSNLNSISYKIEDKDTPLFVVKDGRVVNSAVGFRNIEQIEAMINE